jgi:queuine tRNA-ribosyltransferase
MQKNFEFTIQYAPNDERMMRVGTIHTPHGDIQTPSFIPVGTAAAMKALTMDMMHEVGAQAILSNAFHLYLQPGPELVEKAGGVGVFENWDGPTFTDSGGFQVFSLGKHVKITEEGVTFKDPATGDKHFISPEISMQIQLALGADMIVAFDHLTGLDEVSRAKTLEAYERTHRWLDRCVTEFKRLTAHMKPQERPLLFGVVQGGLDLDLRLKSLQKVQATDVDGIAIGGLSVGESQAEMFTVLKHLAPHYDAKRPRFLLGVGAPADLRFAYENGIDMADCVLPTRNARHATVWVTGDEKVHLTNAKFAEDPLPIDPDCDCSACTQGYSRAFLRHQFKVGEPLAGSLASIHNLRYLSRICEHYREQ